MSDLIHAWRRALPEQAPAATVAKIGADLVARWHEPHRHYHTAEHLEAVLAVIDEYGDRAHDPTLVRLAAWFHDAVYNPKRLDNEEASALLAEAMLPLVSIPADQIAEVARLVRLTASHDPLPGDRNGGLLTDADLAILATPLETYRAYAVAIRREYAHIPDDAFVAGRAAVLTTLLGLPRLYQTPVLRDRWEAAARHNITSELDSLRKDPLPYASI